jgi:hypothetical protein
MKRTAVAEIQVNTAIVAGLAGATGLALLIGVWKLGLNEI